MTIAEKYKREIEGAVSSFKKEVAKIEKSANPYYQLDEVRDYEIGKLRETLDGQIKAIKERFYAEIDAEIKSATFAAKTSKFNPTSEEKAYAENVIQDLILGVRFGYTESEKLEALGKFEKELDLMSEGALSVVKSQLPSVADQLAGHEPSEKKLRYISHILKELRTPAQQYLVDLEEQKASGYDLPYRILRMTHRAYKGEREIFSVSKYE
ncbi:hypothetical protein ACH0B5_07225 [Ureibacillus sp. 179-F W5.1 NHS]|uniref:hypothetical protein n=1 Tax=Ureibacillus sp. 179-F W5.1 NHS TaxID=3374297 RepID=UPI00387A8312